MKLIKRTGGKRNERGTLIQYADFLCPICETEVNRSITHGIRQKACNCRGNTYKHGGTGTRLYKTWKKMNERCYNKNEIGYKHWGGRGIVICDEWRNDFAAFMKWAKSNGYSNDLQIDRVNNDGNYEPSNCRFVTQVENKRNRSFNKLSMEKAETIRNLYKTGSYSQRKLSSMFNTAQSNIWRVLKNGIWVDC